MSGRGDGLSIVVLMYRTYFICFNSSFLVQPCELSFLFTLLLSDNFESARLDVSPAVFKRKKTTTPVVTRACRCAVENIIEITATCEEGMAGPIKIITPPTVNGRFLLLLLLMAKYEVRSYNMWDEYHLLVLTIHPHNNPTIYC